VVVARQCNSRRTVARAPMLLLLLLLMLLMLAF
jgi:hypothetical protein